MSSLYLVATPIGDRGALNPKTFELLNSHVGTDAIFAIEELKVGRRRWLDFGLPREVIESFTLYNEHTRDEVKLELIKKLKAKKKVFLMSDCGLPAFCDPGAQLVSLCHERGIPVRSCAFDNSVALAVALSGMRHDRFIFEGFVPREKEKRKKCFEKICKSKETRVFMDTPYRLNSTLKELAAIDPHKILALCMDLNSENETVIRDRASRLVSKVTPAKREFVMVAGECL